MDTLDIEAENLVIVDSPDILEPKPHRQSMQPTPKSNLESPERVSLGLKESQRMRNTGMNAISEETGEEEDGHGDEMRKVFPLMKV